MADIDPLVSIDWFVDSLDRSDVKVLDGTWILPGDETELVQGYIPGAQFFDLDVVADTKTELKHMLPPKSVFTNAMSRMGISHTDHIIAYDRHGVFSSPRLWWTFRMFGHEKVSVLDGGFPAWIKAGHPVKETPTVPESQSLYVAKPALENVASMDEVEKAIGTSMQVLDARPTGRFYGTSPEPRAGLRSGRIPGSFSLPFGSLRADGIYFKNLNDLAESVKQSGIDLEKPIMTSCGSGITAAGLAFVLHRLGAKDVSVYDGSWAEWGASDAPIEGSDKT